MKMYTLEGMEVELVKKIDEGYLAKMVYSRYYEDDEEIGEMCNQITFYENLYETAPTEKYADEVKRLIDTKNNLEKQVSELISTKRNEEALLNKVNKFPILKALAAYLTGEFKFHLRFSNYEISPKENVYLSS